MNNTQVVIETKFGNIVLEIYNETPLHRDNFLKLVNDDFYKDSLFHRVIKDFMIQGGDNVAQNLDYTVPAEFIYPQYYHKRGALAAARQGDNVNPERRSSASQFYIVTGALFSEKDLNMLEKQRFERLKQTVFQELQVRYKDVIKELYHNGDREQLAEFKSDMVDEATAEAEERKTEILFTPSQRNDYANLGGTPHLDGEYTVFGEVVEGMSVVDKIQNVSTNRSDKPLQDIKMKIRAL